MSTKYYFRHNEPSTLGFATNLFELAKTSRIHECSWHQARETGPCGSPSRKTPAPIHPLESCNVILLGKTIRAMFVTCVEVQYVSRTSYVCDIVSFYSHHIIHFEAQNLFSECFFMMKSFTWPKFFLMKARDLHSVNFKIPLHSSEPQRHCMPA
jgi:hypothetical protein